VAAKRHGDVSFGVTEAATLAGANDASNDSRSMTILALEPENPLTNYFHEGAGHPGLPDHLAMPISGR
jgi:hypothetical protein